MHDKFKPRKREVQLRIMDFIGDPYRSEALYRLEHLLAILNVMPDEVAAPRPVGRYTETVLRWSEFPDQTILWVTPRLIGVNKTAIQVSTGGASTVHIFTLSGRAQPSPALREFLREHIPPETPTNVSNNA
jgi:hypothetical protein